MTSRPHVNLKSDELELLAHRESSNATVLLEISEEISHRRAHPATNRVRDLVTRLLQSVEASGGNEGPDGLDLTATEIPAVLRPAATPAIIHPTRPMDEWEKRYETLRRSFTAESEVLARWGMTSLMPVGMRGRVFSVWRDLIAHGQHPLGLTLTDLERDLKTLNDEFAREAEGPAE